MLFYFVAYSGVADCYALYTVIILCIFLLILAVRLVGGSYDEGRVEVYYNGTWGTVCDDGWDIRDARVVCRLLGFEDALAAHCCANFGYGTGQIWLDDVNCLGYESSLFSCSHNGVGSHNCGHGEDAGVRCKNSTRGENWAIFI